MNIPQFDPLMIVLGMSWFIILVQAVLEWRIISTFSQLLLARGTAPSPPPPVPASAPVVPTPPSSPGSAPAPPPPIHAIVVDPGLIDFIKKEEGFEPVAKWDYKQYTYGYGTRAPGAGATITEADAATALIKEIASAAAAVEAFTPGAPIGVKQALTDLTFNAGAGWESGGLGSAIKAGNYASAKQSILQYNHAGGQVLAGLTKRREAEASWFDNPI